MRKAAVAAIISFGLLAGCDTRQDRVDEWIGNTEARLLSRWGGPDRVLESGGVKYLTYNYFWNGTKTHSYTFQVNTTTGRVIGGSNN